MLEVAVATALLLKLILTWSPGSWNRSRSRRRIECLVGVAVKYPRTADLGVQPHVNGAPVGGNIVYRNRTDRQLGRRVDISAAGRSSHQKTIGGSAARAPLES